MLNNTTTWFTKPGFDNIVDMFIFLCLKYIEDILIIKLEYALNYLINSYMLIFMLRVDFQGSQLVTQGIQYKSIFTSMPFSLKIFINITLLNYEIF